MWFFWISLSKYSRRGSKMILPYNKINSKINSILAKLHNPLAPAPTIFKFALWISTLFLLREKLA